MKIKKTKFKNTFILIHKKKNDKRGFFMRGFCNKELEKQGIKFRIKQSNFSFNKKKLTMRGFHYQKAQYSEKKIITCVKGKALLVIVNIDKKSPNYMKNLKFKLNSNLNRSVLISNDCATAFLTLETQTLIHYYMSNYFKKNQSLGIRYDDPKLKIKWPIKPKIISKRDLGFKFLQNLK
jgi:dTDP-4-dehydrorhamnose 3,5-epimerase